MTVVEFPRVRVSKVLSGLRFGNAGAPMRPLGRALLVGSPSWLEAARRAVAETRASAEATWHEASDLAEASGFVSVCRVDVVVIAAETASGTDWQRFRELLAGLKSAPLLFAFTHDTSAEAIQRLLDQGVEGVLSFHALRLLKDELCETLSQGSRRRLVTLEAPRAL